jgi:predicted AlkP superfamily pyrophosphatase or phosphodiesterase
MIQPVLLLDIVGLTPTLLSQMPRVAAVGADGFQAPVTGVFPALTCPAQSTFLTGAPPSAHGIVGNGWYFRDLGEPLLWRQHNALVGAEKLWETARRQVPSFRTANVCWWYAMGATTDWTVTPRPIYHADGRKSPDCYTVPPSLHDDLVGDLGTFPLFQYWGPGASIESSAWIAGAARRILRTDRPELALVYLPHLDYDLQRFGPDAPEALSAARAVDDVAGALIDDARSLGYAVVVVSEYGITAARRHIDINRVLRRAGLLRVHTQAGMEHLDPWRSRAFAVADHQIAHVYVREPTDVASVRDLLRGEAGIDEVLDADGQRERQVDHARSGELLAVAAPDAWFTYYYWLDDERAPDFARTVEIHRKPGYDPAELFMDPADPLVKARAGLALARKKLGMRYSMNVVPLDPSPVRGTHGRLAADPSEGPVLLCSDPAPARDTVAATDVRDLVLSVAGLVPGA